MDIETWLKKSLFFGILRFLPLALLASIADAGLLWGIRSFMQLLSGDAPFVLWEWALLMALVAALRQIFMFAKVRNSETFLYRTSLRITRWFLGSLQTLSPRLFHNGSGDAKVEAAYESTLSLQANGGVFFQMVQAILQLAIFLPVLIYISWPLTLFLFAAVVPFVAWMQRKLQSLGPAEESLLYARSNFRLSLNAARKIYRNWSGKTERSSVASELDADAEELSQRGLSASVRKNGLSIAMETLSVTAMVIVLAFCALLIERGWMDGTGLVLFCSALLLCYKPVKECSRVLPQFRAASSAYHVLVEFGKLPKRTASNSNQNLNSVAPNAAGLEIHGGNFCYEGTNTPVFCGFNLALDRSKPVLLRGRNGIGKSTLLRLVAGLEEWEAATRGNNGAQSLSEKSDMSERIGQPANVFFIPQDLELPPRRMLLRQLEKNGGTSSHSAGALHEFIEAAGTDRLLRKEGLSGGERSRIALLWALASEAPVVLLDEPMAAIALADRENILLQFLDCAAKQNKWVIMSSHDPFSDAAQSRFNIVEMEHAKG